MASFNRTKRDARYGLEQAPMDGVFLATKKESTQLVERKAKLRAALGHHVDVQKYPRNEVYYATPSKAKAAVSVTFSSDFQPLYHQSHLTAISAAYPLAQFTYDYAEKSEDIFGRWSMRNGIASVATATMNSSYLQVSFITPMQNPRGVLHHPGALEGSAVRIETNLHPS